MMSEKTLSRTIIGVLLLVLLSFMIYAHLKGTEWVIDNLMLMGITLLMYFGRKRYHVNPYLLVLASLGIILHGMGTFGWYATEPFGLRYDHYTHFLGSLVFSIIVVNYLRKATTLSKANIALFAIMISLGFASIIELIEYAGYVWFGPGEGILFYGTGDFGEWQNTVLDIMFNLFGSFTGSMITVLTFKK